MDFEIRWTDSAARDYADLINYILKDNPSSAKNFGNFILRKIERIPDLPELGRVVPEISIMEIR